MTQSIARSLYEAVFEWIVTLLNKTSCGSTTFEDQDGKPWMGVLDIWLRGL